MLEIPETRYAKTDEGLSIAYQTIGKGPPDILLYPTSGCVEVIWDDPSYAHVLHRLTQIGRLILYDSRGIGASDPLPGGAVPTAESWLEDMPVVLDTVSSTTTSILAVGWSGYLGILFAATHPERIDALILIDTFARATRAEDYPIGLLPEQMAAEWEILSQVWGTGAMSRVVAPSRGHDEGFRRWHARYERETASPATMRRIGEFGQTFDVRPFLSAIHVPTLVLHADGAYIPFEHGRYLADHIPGAQLRVFAGRDSFPFNEGVDDLVNDIEEFITGAPPVREPDRALATVLFTDIVASTEHTARLGDKKWIDLLNRHDELISRELERHRGRKVNPTGDGILATFDSPARAVRCAQAICFTVRTLGVEVRAGLHTGEVELRGGDIGGIAVHIGQRVSALARPGEVLVSRTVTDLVVGSRIDFEDRGEYVLKGVPGSWRLFSVAG